MTLSTSTRSAYRGATSPLSFPTLTYLLLLVAIFTVAIRIDAVQGDTWWALRAGKDMWHSRHFIRTDTYSYTAYGRPWPDNAWLYQVLLYLLYAVGKFPLVSLVNAAVATGAVALARPPGRVRWADVVATAPVIALVSLNWSVRPQVMSLLLLALMIRLIHAERWRLIVLLMLVWANLHGDVVFGGVVLVAATLASLIDWLSGRLGPSRADGEEDGQRSRRFLYFMVTSVVSAAATLATPMGWGLWHYVATASSRPGESYIAEWQPSWTAPWITVWFWAWCGVLVLVLLFRWRRLSQWPILLGLCMSLAMAPLAWEAMRNISAFGIVTLPLLIRLLRHRRVFGPRPAPRPGSLMPGARIIIALAVVAAAIASTRTLESPSQLGWTPMSSRVAKAIDSCHGNVYTTYNSGAFLIWFTPQKKVFVDNRQDPYDQKILEYGVGLGDWTSDFKKYDITCAALNLYADPQQIVTLGAMARWPVLYADDQWVVLIDPTSVPKKDIRQVPD